jgi:hypothetical protein
METIQDTLMAKNYIINGDRSGSLVPPSTSRYPDTAAANDVTMTTTHSATGATL